MHPVLDARRVLVGIDFGSTSLAAARWVATHLTGNAELVLAHVIALPRVPSFLRDLVPSSEALVDQIAPQVSGGLRGLASTLGDGPPPRTELLVGIPSERLATSAEELGADMVVVGRTHQRAGTWKRIGSTADRLIRRVRVPVLIATGNLAEEPKRVLAAVDDCDVGLEVLRSARALAMRIGAELIVLHVVSRRVAAYAAATLPLEENAGSVHDAAEATIRAAAEEWLSDALSDAGACDGARLEVRVGDAGSEILAAAERFDADLVVIGSHGADAVARNGTGGVTRFVVRGTRRPVLVVGNGPVVDIAGDSRRRAGSISRMSSRRSATLPAHVDVMPWPAA
jgi:nucleotide-binding universal stress UspA family protein